MADDPTTDGRGDGCLELFVLLGMAAGTLAFWLWAGWRFLRWLFG